ncbi:hypothetical protein [uncultured Arthrobacter sp.]|uniref:hypothetical protein n=1 Tax=uncultured Arthrobacter sp. TaxID=114050 RepID=UPI0028D8AA9C|nr:hypothetical protein [uncultured Arthrobacter sp.]
MPELNNDASDGAAPDVTWPQLAVSGSGPSGAGVADPAVLAILERVRNVPGLPASEHHAAYEAMHDALLEALNEEPQNEEPREQPQQGPGAA